MSKMTSGRKDDCDCESGKSAGQGRLHWLPQLVRVDYEDGSGVIAPAGEVTISARSAADTVGDVISIVCKLFPKLCGGTDGGGGGGGGKPGCYIIIGPDGTEIRICPPPTKIA